MSNYYTPEQIEELLAGHTEVLCSYCQIVATYNDFQYQQSRAREYALHGFLRRLKTLRRCVENIYSFCPPENTDRLTDEDHADLSINLQAFVFNVSGCLDNLAWIWVKEKGIKCSYKEVSFENKTVKSTLPENFRSYWNTSAPKKWRDYLKSFRDALAHRIPLYVPPMRLTSEEATQFKELEQQKWQALLKGDLNKVDQICTEQDSLGQLIPRMTHSFEENAPWVGFHFQVLADWNTVRELSEHFIKALRETV